jgi:hypothetical protein
VNILYLYYEHSNYSWPQNYTDSLKCIELYTNKKVHYCNIAYSVPRYIAKKPYDFILMHFMVPSLLRCFGEYEKCINKFRFLLNHKATKVLFCQDEFFKMDLIEKFVGDIGVQYIFSVAPPDQWDIIYSGIDTDKVKIHRVLTGYLDPVMMDKVKNIPPLNRNIDIGYRASDAPAWLGSHGRLKAEIANVMEQSARKRGLATDIKLSKGQCDFIHGFAWYMFLLRCKGVIGVEGGSSLYDRDGSLIESIKNYVKDHPNASYNEVEMNCFKGLDGNLKLFALSPRHLEACLTKTCQILVEGEYNGILKPWIHYIPLKKDFSNSEEALDAFSDEGMRQQIVNNAYCDIVESGLYTYHGFLNHVFNCLPSSDSHEFTCRYINMRDNFLKLRMRCEHAVADRLSPNLRKKLKRLMNR